MTQPIITTFPYAGGLFGGVSNTNVCATTSFYSSGTSSSTKPWKNPGTINITILNYKKFKQHLQKQVEPV